MLMTLLMQVDFLGDPLWSKQTLSYRLPGQQIHDPVVELCILLSKGLGGKLRPLIAKKQRYLPGSS